MEVGRDIDPDTFVTTSWLAIFGLGILAAFIPFVAQSLFDRVQGWITANPNDPPLIGALRIVIRTGLVCVVLLAGVVCLLEGMEMR